MPSSTSSLGRYSSYSLYSSYPTYRTSGGSTSSSSYLNRTTSLDRTAYTSAGGNYYRYTGGTKALNALPPRAAYSSSSDTYRSSRSVRASPVRSSYSSRLSDSGNGIDRDSRYSFHRTRDISASRDSGYGSLYTSRDRSVDYGYGTGDISRRSSLYRRDSDYDRDDDDKVTLRVSDRIRAYECVKDPVEERLALRRKRLGLSPTRDSPVGSRSPKPPIYHREDNRRATEENGNDDGRRTSVSDLCRKYDTNLNLRDATALSQEVSGGCSGGAGPSVTPKDPSIMARPASPIDIKAAKPRLDSYKDEKESSSLGASPKGSSDLPRTSSPAGKESEIPKATSAKCEPESSRSSYTLPLRSRERREKMKERIAQRLSNELEDGESPPSRRRSPTGSSSDSYGESSNGLVGLRNIGNTCFLNSITQCLSNTRCLLEYMLSESYSSDINTTLSTMKGDLVRAFGSLLNEMWREGASGPVNTGSFKAQIQRFAPVFIGYAQHDAQEFLRKLLEGLHEDVNRVTARPRPITEDIDETLDDHQKAMEAWKRYLRYDDSKIVDMFVGQLNSSLHCSVCGHRSVTFDPFWDLSLPIPSRSGQVKLSQCLDLFTKEEVLDGDERPTCSKCNERRKMTKTFSIQKFPKVLVLHLKRFSPHERWRGKLTCMVEFPLDSLDLSRYAACSSISSQYRLIGVANHSGTALSGHYTAYCRHPYLKTWHEYNDSRVSSISSNRVCSAEAYVLFYELNSY